MQVFLQMMCTSGDTKVFQRLNDQNIVRFPSGKTIKLKRYELQHQQGVTPIFLQQMVKSLNDTRHLEDSPGTPFLVLKYDEIYVRSNLVFNPHST